MGPLPNGHSWLINGGDPNHLLTRIHISYYIHYDPYYDPYKTG